MLGHDLPFHRIDIAQHPKLGNFAAGRREERGAGPADIAAGRRGAEELAAMLAGKAHAAGGAVGRRHHILDGADEILKRCVHRAQIGDEAARPAQLDAERAVEAEISSKDGARLRLVGLVPDHVVEAADEIGCGRGHAAVPFPHPGSGYNGCLEAAGSPYIARLTAAQREIEVKDDRRRRRPFGPSLGSISLCAPVWPCNVREDAAQGQLSVLNPLPVLRPPDVDSPPCNAGE